jgi:hypothetical protein
MSARSAHTSQAETHIQELTGERRAVDFRCAPVSSIKTPQDFCEYSKHQLKRRHVTVDHTALICSKSLIWTYIYSYIREVNNLFWSTSRDSVCFHRIEMLVCSTQDKSSTLGSGLQGFTPKQEGKKNKGLAIL